MKTNASFVVIGDVVASRAAADRVLLHQVLSETLAAANERFGSDLRITVGDEYQGYCQTLGQALGLVWWLRIQLRPRFDVRHGIGVGEVHALAVPADPSAPSDPSARSEEPGQPVDLTEDGPGWWAAREALEQVAAEQRRARSRHRRDRLAVAAGPGSSGGPGSCGGGAWSAVAMAVNSALVGRDELTAHLSARDLAIVRGLVAGESQRAIAERLSISGSAVSQRIRNQGIGTLLEMTAQLTRIGSERFGSERIGSEQDTADQEGMTP